MSTTDLVTGAFGFTGNRIAERLLGGGRRRPTLLYGEGDFLINNMAALLLGAGAQLQARPRVALMA